MTQAQAARLGKALATARARKGLSLRELSALTGYDIAWHLRLERGKYLDPSADGLAKLGAVLGIAPERMNTLSRGKIAASLPEVEAYFRAKYQLSAEDAARVERYVQRLKRQAS